MPWPLLLFNASSLANLHSSLMIHWTEMANLVMVSCFGSEGKMWCRILPRGGRQTVGVSWDQGGHQHHSTLLLRRGKELKAPFEELLLPPLLLTLLLLQLSLLLILLQGSK
jgi:hypothetical protein